MDDLLIHPQTKKLVKSFINKPSHGLNLIGNRGSGRRSLALAIAWQLLGNKSKDLENSSQFKMIEPEDGSIPISEIRAIQNFLKLKTLGKGDIRRIVYVDQADKLGIEAQNAFLKMLEEPPADTLFILSTLSGHSLLTTVHSRLTPIVLQAPTKKQIIDYFSKQGVGNNKIEKNYLLSDGQIGLMSELISLGNKHPLVEQVAQAKKILASDYFSRLSEVEALSKDKDQLGLFLSAVHKIISVSLKKSASRNNQREIKRLINMLKITQDAINDLEKNVNTKLSLTNFMLQL